MADKRVRIGVDDFLPAYLQAAKDGLTREQFAAKLGVKPLTVYQRVIKLRQDARMAGLPHLAGEESRVSVADKAAAIFASFEAKAAG